MLKHLQYEDLLFLVKDNDGIKRIVGSPSRPARLMITKISKTGRPGTREGIDFTISQMDVNDPSLTFVTESVLNPPVQA